MNYARFLNAVSLARQPSPIRKITALMLRSPKTVISLAAGAPNAKLFPFESAEITLRDGSKIVLDDTQMSTGLQYGATQGPKGRVTFNIDCQANLVEWLKEMQKTLHKPPTFSHPQEEGGMNLVVTPGCQDGICKSLEMLVNPGDHVLIDCPTYPGTLAVLRPLGCNMLPVETDQDGMKPEVLRKILSRWSPQDAKNPDCTIPKVLYTIPNGVNPTGASLSTDRKREIYKIAQEYDLLILEDDPYYFLQFSETRKPSFLSMDTDGRVLRFDSFSKIMSSGLRVGFATGPHPLIERIMMHMMISSMQTSTFSQVMIYEALNRWGLDGFLKHVDDVRSFYSEQKDVMISSAKKWLTGLAEWDEPQAGMFVWFKLLGIDDTKKLIEEKAVKKEVLFVPGCAFMPDPNQPCPYVRAAYSQATPEQIDMGLERLASLIKEELAEKNK